jgi:hypothetical protein
LSFEPHITLTSDCYHLPGQILVKSPEPPVEVLLAVAPKVIPNPALGADPNEIPEVAGVGSPNMGPLGFVLRTPKAGFPAAIAKGLLPAAALGTEAKSPSYIGFVSALSPLDGVGDGVLEKSPLDEPIVDPNDLKVSPGPRVPEPARLVTSRLNTVGFGLVLAGFGDGVLSL